MKEIEYIQNKFSNLGKEISEIQGKQFFIFYQNLVEKNKDMNLTGITEFEEVVLKHFIDSGMFTPTENTSIIDVGTGAGFPGIPLKILNQNCEMFLLDSLRKRVDFLKESAALLGLEGIEIEHGRAEDVARSEKRESFDYAVSRAVAALPLLCEYCLPFVKIGGLFVAYKGEAREEEVKAAENALQILGGQVEKIEKFVLPGTEEKRSLIYIRKISKTPEKYPRRAGKPEKKPL